MREIRAMRDFLSTLVRQIYLNRADLFEQRLQVQAAQISQVSSQIDYSYEMRNSLLTTKKQMHRFRRQVNNYMIIRAFPGLRTMVFTILLHKSTMYHGTQYFCFSPGNALRTAQTDCSNRQLLLLFFFCLKQIARRPFDLERCQFTLSFEENVLLIILLFSKSH